MPPDNSQGYWSIEEARPTDSTACSTIRLRSSLPSFLRRSGKATFSETFIHGYSERL